MFHDPKGFDRQFDRQAEVPAPLVLDMDGTLLRTNLLGEGVLRLVRANPLAIFLLGWWLCRGRAHLKHQVAARTGLAVDLLPVSADLIAHAAAAHAGGRTVVLASAANQAVAHAVAARFPFVSEVIGSGPRTNLKGAHKAAALAERFPDGFVYAGDSVADLKVWHRATAAIYAGRSRRLGRRLHRTASVEADFTAPTPSARMWVRALRLHQWAKNLLVFVPVVLAGHMGDAAAMGRCLGAFVAIGLVASATYILNDLLDLEEDRRHWTKRHRPMAAGAIGIVEAAQVAAVLLPAGLVLGWLCGPAVAALVAGYCLTTSAYSFYLKRVPVVDVAVLATLFTLRLVIGAAAAGVPATHWLLVFSMFLFLSLGLAKRHTELFRLAQRDGGTAMPGRGYAAADLPFVQTLGLSGAITSVLILVLYLVNEAFPGGRYLNPAALWGMPVLLGLWLGRVWLLCGRGQLHDDPVVFATRDRPSLLLGAGIVLSVAVAVPLP